MATIKSYTDMEQSKKLAEILPLESADQTWQRIAIAGANLNVQDKSQYKHNGDVPFIYSSGTGVPCWSLAALLGILPQINAIPLRVEKVKARDGYNGYYYHIEYGGIVLIHYSKNLVDACYEIILKLHEYKML